MDMITIVVSKQRVTQRNKNSESVSKTLSASERDDKVRAWIDKNSKTQPEVCRLARLILSSFSCACSAIAFC